ncbi:MAG: class I SAM-dependent methyltransferase [Chloroflexi bacterium]|nr:class I SAM-dependent methyltransferase [Chloroflexota bacterium]MCL5075289.1 class I SAM-dependent methyltransferase [Chloroflexota bacterium]
MMLSKDHLKERQASDVYAAHWEQRPSVDFAATSIPKTIKMSKVTRFIDSLRLPPKARALDIGCADGLYLALLAQRNFEVVGVDYVWPNVSKAILQTKDIKGNLGIIQGDAERLPFATGVFDLCTHLAVLEHLPHPEESLAECSRVLRDGGHLVLYTCNDKQPFFLALRRMLAPKSHVRWWNSLGHSPEGYFSERRLKEMLIRNSLRLKTVQYNHALFSYIYDLCLFQWLLKIGNELLLRRRKPGPDRLSGYNSLIKLYNSLIYPLLQILDGLDHILFYRYRCSFSILIVAEKVAKDKCLHPLDEIY